MAGLSSQLLRLDDVHKTYPNGHHALDGVSLDVAKGEVVVIVGPSGCGKSTLLRCVNGLESIDSGDITLDGESLLGRSVKWSRVRQRVGMVFQSYDLFPTSVSCATSSWRPSMCRRGPRQMRGPRRSNCSGESAWQTGRRTTPASSRVGRSSAWRSCGH